MILISFDCRGTRARLPPRASGNNGMKITLDGLVGFDPAQWALRLNDRSPICTLTPPSRHSAASSFCRGWPFRPNRRRCKARSYRSVPATRWFPCFPRETTYAEIQRQRAIRIVLQQLDEWIGKDACASSSISTSDSSLKSWDERTSADCGASYT
jgi:hypothetical protein